MNRISIRPESGPVPPIAEGEVFAFLDDGRNDGDRCTSLLFREPREIIECHTPDQVESSFEKLSAGLAAGLHAVSLFSYELGYCLEERLKHLASAEPAEPLFTVVLFKHRRRLTQEECTTLIERHMDPTRPAVFHGVRSNVRKPEYYRANRAIKKYIREGDVYQVNFTFKYLFRHFGNPFSLYCALRQRQRVPYGAFIRLPGRTVLSLSPELFLRKRGETLTVRPMKGTMPRGETDCEDALQAARLREDAKNRAENVMIVDLLRNDLSRIARLGSVKVERLFEVEPYETLYQMTSTVTAKVDPALSLRQLFAGVYPCGSITGAPKIRSMEIIRELEAAPRGLYTGAIGYLEPDGDACFNVAIRTAVLRDNGTGEMGIGSGIVHDSHEKQEYEECLLKARFLTGADPGFRLIESLRFEAPAGFARLTHHLARLKISAQEFLFRCDVTEIRDALLRYAAALDPDRAYRVRLLLAKDGRSEIDAAPIPRDEDALSARRVVLSDRRTDSANPLLYHKTTARQLYDSELGRLKRECGCYEVLFRNEREEITEGARTNIFIEKAGRLYTPPIACGLLNGVMRRVILGNPSTRASERVLTEADLIEADRIFVTNSVRGLVEVRYLPDLARANPQGAHRNTQAELAC